MMDPHSEAEEAEDDEEEAEYDKEEAEEVQSSVKPFQDAGRQGSRNWKERCSSEHVRRDVAASVTLQFGALRM